MGLDMYLYKMPRFKNATPEDITNIEGYLDYLKSKEDPKSQASKMTCKEYCGVNPAKINPEFLEFYKRFYKEYSYKFSSNYKWFAIKEEVAYWRKVNAIHYWFVKNVQGGVDDCDYHEEVTKEKIEELISDCTNVLDSGTKISKDENGENIYLLNKEIAERILPTSPGFFFGSYDYDTYYAESLIETVKTLKEILWTTNFETEMIYYCSSW